MEEELRKLRKRAEDAALGYGSDVNIDYRVYSKDILYLLGCIKTLKAEVESLVSKVPAE